MLKYVVVLALVSHFSHLALADKPNVGFCQDGMKLQDEGMWPFNGLPREHIKATYNFEVTDQWVDHVMKSSVRFNTGGSGSWVSSNGILMTNHHVAAPTLQEISDKDHDYLTTGFYAPTLDKEIKAKHLEINQLVSIEDVTARVLGAVKPEMSPVEAKKAKEKAIGEIETESKAKTGLRSDVVTLYLGGQYHLYRYKKYNDIRLVFAPERESAFFGGDPDNFEFPRYDLDAAFFRVYENDKPVNPENFFTWKESGAGEKELVFVSGNPGSTKRLYTAEHMVLDEDVVLPSALELVSLRISNLENYMKLGPEQKRQAQEDYFSLQNSYKVRKAELAGLNNSALNLIGEKRKSEEALRKAAETHPELQKYLGAWKEISDSNDYLLKIRQNYRFLEGALGIDSVLFDHARNLVRIAAEDQKPNSNRLPEYQDARRASLVEKITSQAPIYKEFEEFKLVASLNYMVKSLGAFNPLVQLVLNGKTPEVRAKELVDASTLDAANVREAYLKGGKDAIAASKDPFIILAGKMDAAAREVRQNYDSKVTGVQEAAYEKIAAIRFALEGNKQYPDATFSPRLAFGRVLGYEQDGQPINSSTTMGGAFEYEKQHGGVEPYKLPESWHKALPHLKLDTPFNQVTTADIIGGNSGSPVVNKEAQIVGLIFDGNRQSLVARYAYTANADNPGRAVSVHAGAILHALQVIYNAQPLVDELRGTKP